MDSTNRRQIPGGLIFFGWYDGAVAVYWPYPRLAPCGSRYFACDPMRGCVPINVQEGAMAVYWPSPAAGAMRLTVLRLRPDAWLRSDQRARRGYGRVLAITRGWRHAAHGASPATQFVAAF